MPEKLELAYECVNNNKIVESNRFACQPGWFDNMKCLACSFGSANLDQIKCDPCESFCAAKNRSEKYSNPKILQVNVERIV